MEKRMIEVTQHGTLDDIPFFSFGCRLKYKDDYRSLVLGGTSLGCGVLELSCLTDFDEPLSFIRPLISMARISAKENGAGALLFVLGQPRWEFWHERLLQLGFNLLDTYHNVAHEDHDNEYLQRLYILKCK